MGTQPPADVIAAAKAADARWHIPASVQLAQWALESGWGKHVPPGSNNYFGIKARIGEPCSTAGTKEVINGNVVSINAGFRVFKDAAECFDYHAQLLATNPVYAPARAFLPNLKMFCNALGGATPQHPSYATDPAYGQKLMAIIQGSNLEAYDA